MERRMEGSGDDVVNGTEWSSMEKLIEKLGDLEWLAGRIRTALVPREITQPSEDEASPEEPPINSAMPIPGRDFRNPLGIIEWTIKPEYVTPKYLARTCDDLVPGSQKSLVGCTRLCDLFLQKGMTSSDGCKCHMVST